MVSTQIIIGAIDSGQEVSATNQTNTVVRRNGAGTQDHLYIFFIEATTQNLRYVKSTDGGATFASSVLVDSGTDYDQVVVWYDRWTPSDTTGNIIHILAGGNLADDMRYFSLDTSTDTAGTNNNITVASWTTLTTNNGYSLSICKADNGDLFAAGIGSVGPSGIQVFKSTDSGANWSDVTTGGTTVFDSADDSILLMPLSTDDDIILIGVDDSAAQLRYVVYDNVGDAWDVSSTLLESGPNVAFGHRGELAATINKTNGDIFLVYNDLSTDNHLGSLAFRSFPDSTRTWSSKVLINNDYSTLGLDEVTDKLSLSLCRDQTDGTLILAAMMGNISVEVNPYLFFSSDSGSSWSDGFLVPGVTPDDLRKCNLPVVMVDQVSGFYLSWNDDANSDLVGLIDGVHVESFSGNTFDSDGSTALASVDCTSEETAARQITGITFGKNRPVHGKNVSDGSGNYSNFVFRLYTDESGTANYQTQFYKQGASDADDEMDLSRTDTED